MNKVVEISLTAEQKSTLQPVFDLIKQANGGGGAIHGEAFEYGIDSGIAQFRFLNRAQAEIAKTAFKAALEIEEREELEARRRQVIKNIAQLETDKARLDNKISEMDARAVKA